MRISVLGENAAKYNSLRDIFTLFYKDPGIKNAVPSNLDSNATDFIVEVSEKWSNNLLEVNLKLTDNCCGCTYTQSLRETILDNQEIENQLKRMTRLATYRSLVKLPGNQEKPWGILTGIRPTKIVHRLLDKNYSHEEIKKHLIDFYEVSPIKANLLLNVVERQRPHLLSRSAAENVISIYIGIPFCPSRCSYCSFPAYSVEKEGQLMEPFLTALHKEIVAIGKYLKENNKKIQTIYLGGGTPTSLTAFQLEELLVAIHKDLLTSETVEFTVEAGRPDSITKEKLTVIKKYGATRISINPQTMNQDTLSCIGRNHSPQEVVDSFKLARELGFNNINMDLIIGLPGEGLAEIVSTMNQIILLNPENITVHTLALKRASRLNQQGYSAGLKEDDDETKLMLDEVMKAAKAMNMEPYYLYRQKQMLAQLENIGFAKEGFACLYNIQMMEERQTILGLGAGSASKLVNTKDWTLDSLYNPKDPLNYIERIDEMIEKKLIKIQDLS